MRIKEDRKEKKILSASDAVVVRFAPSPTGRVHVGNIWGALLNYLYARQHNGKFILRIDDTDKERCRQVYVDDIKHALSWLGLVWSETFRQSERLEAYQAAIETLKRKGRLYACYETKLELEYKRKRQLAQKRPPIYDRASLTLTAEQRLAFEQEGRRPYWRFKLEHFAEEEVFEDLIRGDVKFNASSLSDPVLVREDNQFLYTLTSVVDDLDTGVTHIIRGADHITNTGVQIQLMRAFGAHPPIFAHFALLLTEKGEPFSKRTGAASVAELEEAGLEPMTINNVLAALGRESSGRKLALSLDELVQTFDLKSLGVANIPLSSAAFDRTNSALLRMLSYDQVQERLREMFMLPKQILEPFWLAVRDNLNRFSDVQTWIKVLYKDGVQVPESQKPDVTFRGSALSTLPPEPWDDTTWDTWLSTLSGKLKKPPASLFAPLRLLLTGKEKGPPLKGLLPLIGYEKVKQRLS